MELDVVADLRRDDVGLEPERGLRNGLDAVGCRAGLCRGDGADDGEGVGWLHFLRWGSDYRGSRSG